MCDGAGAYSGEQVGQWKLLRKEPTMYFSNFSSRPKPRDPGSSFIAHRILMLKIDKKRAESPQYLACAQ